MTTFKEWFDATYRDLDGGTTGLPGWLADDLLLAWNAGQAAGSSGHAPSRPTRDEVARKIQRVSERTQRYAMTWDVALQMADEVMPFAATSAALTDTREALSADLEKVQCELDAAALRVTDLEAALKFYRDAWQYKPGPTGLGLEWSPKEELLDVCGTRAKDALARKDRETSQPRNAECCKSCGRTDAEYIISELPCGDAWHREDDPRHLAAALTGKEGSNG